MVFKRNSAGEPNLMTFF